MGGMLLWSFWRNFADCNGLYWFEDIKI
jgi:hypothetical protein